MHGWMKQGRKKLEGARALDLSCRVSCDLVLFSEGQRQRHFSLPNEWKICDDMRCRENPNPAMTCDAGRTRSGHDRRRHRATPTCGDRQDANDAKSGDVLNVDGDVLHAPPLAADERRDCDGITVQRRACRPPLEEGRRDISWC
jgi:hypothetical protein